MKFVHIADFHLDRPFINLSDRDIMGNLKRLEQRKVFKKIIEYIKQEEIPYFFISGDLYEHKYIRKSTIEYIDSLFRQIPDTKIYITPGNHDPKLKNSYYSKYKWNENVKIFDSKIEKVELEDCNIYGYGFDDFYCTNCGIEKLEIQKSKKPNILIIHATLDGASIEEKQYNSISKKLLKEKGFDYVALGHIHKTNFTSKNRTIYPGSTISLGFDELGKHGMVVGDITEEKINLKYVELDESYFKQIDIDVTQIDYKEDLIEKINDLEIKENEYIKIVLMGERNFEINVDELFKYISNSRIIKIKDKTKIAYDLKEMSNENTLKGLFAKSMLDKLNEEDISQKDIEIIEKAIEIGFEALS